MMKEAIYKPTTLPLWKWLAYKWFGKKTTHDDGFMTYTHSELWGHTYLIGKEKNSRV